MDLDNYGGVKEADLSYYILHLCRAVTSFALLVEFLKDTWAVCDVLVKSVLVKALLHCMDYLFYL